VLFAPIALHSAFDFPLLILQQNADLDSANAADPGIEQRADRLQRDRLCRAPGARVGRHHAPRTEIARERLGSCGGCGRCWSLAAAPDLRGLVFVLGAAHRWLVNPTANMTAVAGSVGLISILIGIALLVATTAVYFSAATGCAPLPVAFRPQGQG